MKLAAVVDSSSPSKRSSAGRTNLLPKSAQTFVNVVPTSTCGLLTSEIKNVFIIESSVNLKFLIVSESTSGVPFLNIYIYIYQQASGNRTVTEN